jgi:hypothetical protein
LFKNSSTGEQSTVVFEWIVTEPASGGRGVYPPHKYTHSLAGSVTSTCNAKTTVHCYPGSSMGNIFWPYSRQCCCDTIQCNAIVRLVRKIAIQKYIYFSHISSYHKIAHTYKNPPTPKGRDVPYTSTLHIFICRQLRDAQNCRQNRWKHP